MKYYKTNNIHIIEVPVSDFKIILNDSKKKSAASKNYCNAGFFAAYSENNQPFTLPVAHLVCDYNATSSATKKYCTERGKFNGSKFTFDSSAWSFGNPCYNKHVSTLLVDNNKAIIRNIASIPSGYNYAVSGIPIMQDGAAVNFETDVQTQGWDSSPLYGTWHIFIGLKQDSANAIYVIGMQTTTWNMVKTNEAYWKFKELGMYDVIKLDGGGSFHMNVDGKAVASTWEDRRVNTIICFDSVTGGKVGESSHISFDSVDTPATTTANKNTVNKTSNKSNTTNKTTTTTPATTKKTSPSSIIKNVIRNKHRRINSFRFLRSK